MFGGGYAIGYFFGPFPSLEDLTGIKAVGGAPEYKGEVILEKFTFFCKESVVLIFCFYL